MMIDSLTHFPCAALPSPTLQLTYPIMKLLPITVTIVSTPAGQLLGFMVTWRGAGKMSIQDSKDVYSESKAPLPMSWMGTLPGECFGKVHPTAEREIRLHGATLSLNLQTISPP
jgi:hypothetical protein